MGKAAMCIKMLEILNTGKIYKVSELADILETNSRNIGEYRKELEECGYYIETIPGRYGGYKLKDNSIIPSLKLTEEEKEAIIDGFNILMSKKDFLINPFLQLRALSIDFIGVFSIKSPKS